jgi:hypothetical protein
MLAKSTKKTYREVETEIGRIYGPLLLIHLIVNTHMSQCGQYDCGVSCQETSKSIYEYYDVGTLYF